MSGISVSLSAFARRRGGALIAIVALVGTWAALLHGLLLRESGWLLLAHCIFGLFMSVLMFMGLKTFGWWTDV